MTTIVIGGHSRKVGKTAVTEGLIRAFDRYPWTAAKISTHWHEGPPEDVSCAIHEEQAQGGNTDSARYLAAGAARSFWIRIQKEQMAESWPALQPVLQSSPFVIIESNCILRLFRPELYILVLRSDVEEFKESARETLQSAHAILMIVSGASAPGWSDFVQRNSSGIPLFTTHDPHVLPPEFLEFVRSRIADPDKP